MPLNVLWKSTLATKIIPEHQHLIPDSLNLIVETNNEKSLEHKDWLDVLIDGRESPLLDAPKLKHIIVPFVGIREELRQAITKRPHIKLHNSHYNDTFVAQHAVALLLAASNLIIESDQEMRQGNWQAGFNGGPSSIFLEGKTCLLLGYGAIAKAIEPRVKGLGMTVEALKRNPDPQSKLKMYTPKQLHEALSNADVIMLSLPSTPETKNLLNEAAFKTIKPNSILINVGRGDTIDQHALYNALKNKQLHAAGIDVWWNYPKGKEARQNTYPADAPLHELPNIIMSPHRASNTQSTQEASFKDVIKTLNAIAKGETRNLVDPTKGY